MQYSQEVRAIFESMFRLLEDNQEFDRSLLENLKQLYQSGELHDEERLRALMDSFSNGGSGNE
jgi:hypothetical protein